MARPRRAAPVQQEPPEVQERAQELRDLNICRHWIPCSPDELVALSKAEQPALAGLRKVAASYLEPLVGETREMFAARIGEAE